MTIRERLEKRRAEGEIQFEDLLGSYVELYQALERSKYVLHCSIGAMQSSAAYLSETQEAAKALESAERFINGGE